MAAAYWDSESSRRYAGLLWDPLALDLPVAPPFVVLLARENMSSWCEEEPCDLDGVVIGSRMTRGTLNWKERKMPFDFVEEPSVPQA